MSAEIDATIAPLVEAIWKLGIRTDWSCEAFSAHLRPLQPMVDETIARRALTDGKVQIMFSTMDADRWLHIVADRRPRQGATPRAVVRSALRRGWHVRVTVTATESTRVDVHTRVTVFFPRRDIAFVLRQLRAASSTMKAL